MNGWFYSSPQISFIRRPEKSLGGSKREKTSQPSKGKKAVWDLIVCPKVDRGKAKINIDAIGPSHPFGVFCPLGQSISEGHHPHTCHLSGKGEIGLLSWAIRYMPQEG